MLTTRLACRAFRLHFKGMIAQPAPKQDVLARRDEIVAALRAAVPGDGVIAEALRLKPYETDGLAIYRQLPLAVVRRGPPSGSPPSCASAMAWACG